MMEDCVNKNLDDRKNYMSDIHEIGVDREEEETKDINNKDAIHRYMNENEPETNQYT